MVLEQVKKMCAARQITIAELERKANVGNGVISSWEEGNPKLKTLQKVAYALGVDVAELVKEQQP